ncbi:hypothetical protein KEM52_003848 [Ascosphaera acerosa]|nr:hypothetical protein KEM52_003848 [Ascosphaera acerosa]
MASHTLQHGSQRAARLIGSVLAASAPAATATATPAPLLPLARAAGPRSWLSTTPLARAKQASKPAAAAAGAAAGTGAGPGTATRPASSKLADLNRTIAKSASTSSNAGSGAKGASATGKGAPAPAPGGIMSSTATTSAPPVNATGRVDNLSKSGLSDNPFDEERAAADTFADSGNGNGNGEHIDWTRSYHGLSAEPFSKEAAAVLLQETPVDDVEIKPDGIVYLPEIKINTNIRKDVLIAKFKLAEALIK